MAKQTRPSAKNPTAKKKPVTRAGAAKKAAQKNGGSFWKPPAKGERRPALTPALIKAQEKSLGIRFPAALLKLLREQNGGYLVNPQFVLKGQSYELTDLPRLGNIGSLAVEYADHLEMAEGKLSKPEWIFPLCGDGHWFLAMDYRKVGPQGEPEIAYVDLEGRASCKKVADSFDAFLAGQQKGDQPLAVNFDEIDPGTLIGEVDLESTHKAGKTTKVTYQARLCLTESQVVLYTYTRWERPRQKSKETWERAAVKLRELDPEWLRINKLGGYIAVPTKSLYVYADRHLGGVRGLTCEREGTGGWKKSAFGPIVYMMMTATDVPLLEKCREQILEAHRRQKKA